MKYELSSFIQGIVKNTERMIKMKKKKFLLAFMSTILSMAFLFGCNGVDEDEPDPTEEPSEQREDIVN